MNREAAEVDRGAGEAPRRSGLETFVDDEHGYCVRGMERERPVERATPDSGKNSDRELASENENLRANVNNLRDAVDDLERTRDRVAFHRGNVIALLMIFAIASAVARYNMLESWNESFAIGGLVAVVFAILGLFIWVWEKYKKVIVGVFAVFFIAGLGARCIVAVFN